MEETTKTMIMIWGGFALVVGIVAYTMFVARSWNEPESDEDDSWRDEKPIGDDVVDPAKSYLPYNVHHPFED